MNGLAPVGQVAAIILVLYLFVSVLIGLVLAAVLMFILAGLREQAEHIRKLRPAINRLNYALTSAQKGEPLPEEVADNQFFQAISQIPRVAATLPAKASAVEQSVEQNSNRVAHAVIEFHARTEMVKGMAKAFFLPGLTRSRSGRIVERAPEPVVVQREEINEPPPYEEMVMVQRRR
jgi:predicted PurR-regulated permease PerM